MGLVSTNKLETGSRYELTVEVDRDAFEAALEKAYRKNVKKMSVSGFRQGKAPRKMVEKMYGESVFFEDAINELYPTALNTAIEESKLEVVARPEVEVTSVSKEEGFTFKAICVVKPEVEIKDYKGIRAEKTVKTVSDAEVSERIASMQERNARQVEVTDRPAQKGDIVLFDFDGYADGAAFDGGKADGFSLELGSGQFIPGFEEQIEGKAIDEEFDVSVTFPEDYHAEELKGREAVFKCKLHEIKRKELPELDDEFAKDVSEFDTLDELKADIRSKMQETADKDAGTALENKLIDTVIENMTAEIPEEMIEARIDDMIRDFEYRLQSQNMSLDIYLQYTGMDAKAFRETFTEQAGKQVRVRLALEKIVELEGITVTDEELEAEYQKVAQDNHMEIEQIKSFVRQEDLSQDLAVHKAIDLVKETAEVTEAAE